MQAPRASRLSQSSAGYDGVGRCRVAVRSVAIPDALRLRGESHRLAAEPLDVCSTAGVVAEISAAQLAAAARLDRRARARTEAAARRQADELDAIRQRRDAAAAEDRAREQERRRSDTEERRRAAVELESRRAADTRRGADGEEAERARGIARAADERERLERVRQRATIEAQDGELARRLRDESIADSSAAYGGEASAVYGGDAPAPGGHRARAAPPESTDGKLRRLAAATGGDAATCTFLLDCAGGDVDTACVIYEQNYR